MTLRALIFDVDGTLAETEKVHLIAYNSAFIAAGRDWAWSKSDFIDLLKHAGAKEQLRAYADRIGADVSDFDIRDLHRRKMQAYAEILAEGGALDVKPGIRELVRDARSSGLRVGVATASHRENVDALCRACWGQPAGSVFDVLATGDEVGQKKPSPEVYELALTRLGLSANEAIAIEDSRNGVLAAVRAGLRVLAVPSEYNCHDDLSDADWIVRDVRRDNLPGYLLRHLGMRSELSYIEQLLAGAETAQAATS